MKISDWAKANGHKVGEVITVIRKAIQEGRLTEDAAQNANDELSDAELGVITAVLGVNAQSAVVAPQDDKEEKEPIPLKEFQVYTYSSPEKVATFIAIDESEAVGMYVQKFRVTLAEKQSFRVKLLRSGLKGGYDADARQYQLIES